MVRPTTDDKHSRRIRLGRFGWLSFQGWQAVPSQLNGPPDEQVTRWAVELFSNLVEPPMGTAVTEVVQQPGLTVTLAAVRVNQRTGASKTALEFRSIGLVGARSVAAAAFVVGDFVVSPVDAFA